MLNKLKSVFMGNIQKTRQLNRGDLIKSYVEGKSISEGYPVELIIEPTNYCNLNCIMCPRDRMKRKIGMMDLSLFKKIIDESKNYVEFIYLHLFGESLFHKDIFRMITYAERAGINVGLSTNVTMLSEKNTFNLLNSNLHLLILSLDNPSKDAYNKIRVGGDYEKIEKTIIYFLNELEKFKYKPEVVLQMIDLDCSRAEQNLFKNKFSKYSSIHVKMKGFCDWAGQVEEINKLVSSKAPLGSNSKCFEPWRALTIYWDGTVVPCCNDFDGAYIRGNMRKSNIKEIWNGAFMQEFRKSHLVDKSQMNLCKSCPTVNLTHEECLITTSPFYPYEREIEYYCRDK
jgi:radical SAM protein with 4Fe4S-binding SPASM domain